MIAPPYDRLAGRILRDSEPSPAAPPGRTVRARAIEAARRALVRRRRGRLLRRFLVLFASAALATVSAGLLVDYLAQPPVEPALVAPAPAR